MDIEGKYGERSEGPIWRKWDLHFHTPSSYDYQHKGATNQEIVEALVKAGVEVVAITDHHRIDGTHRELQKRGDRLTVLPGIELRSELGGSKLSTSSESSQKEKMLPISGRSYPASWTLRKREVKKRGRTTAYIARLLMRLK